MDTRRYLLLPLLASIMAGSLRVAHADDFNPFTDSDLASQSSTLVFLSEVSEIASGEPFHVLFKLTHPPNWHSYFINPGYVGASLTPNWNLPPGFEVERVGWPVPHIGSTAGKKTYGYEPTVSHLFRITPPPSLTEGATVKVTASPRWQICDESTCRPEPGIGAPETASSLIVKVGPSPKVLSGNAGAFSEARAMLPAELPSDLKIQAIESPDTITLILSPATAVPDGDIYFYDYDQLLDAQSNPVLTRNDTDVRWELARSKDTDQPLGSHISGILTIGKNGYQLDALLGAEGGDRVSFGRLLAILGGMFLGGMILNLMPCVFPVIGIKIMSFVQQSGEDRRTILLHGVIYAIGVLLSFWVLSGILLALREGAIGEGGQDVTWGYQLQNPWVMWSLMLVIFALAMNMYGVFEIGTSATSVGSNLTHKQGAGGSFFSGVLATIVATPCSAPFLGVAIGLAFSLPPLLFLLAFTVMALGLAFPYVLLSAFPGLISRLPRPGPWMESFKQAMAFLLFGTTGFLLWSFLSLKDVGLERMLPIVLGLTFVGIAGWIYGRWCVVSRTKPTRLTGFILTLVFAGLGLACSKPPATGLEWEVWSPEAVEKANASGRPVFVDFTATWCATCQVNKSRAYNAKVRALFAKHDILALKADYTNQDPRIARAIAALNRRAVPVNVLYHPEKEEPRVTKELFGSSYMANFLREALEP